MISSPASCPICELRNLEIYLEGESSIVSPSMVGSSRTEAPAGRILRCQDCRFAFRDLRPSDAELAKLYKEMDIQGYELEVNGRSKTAEAHLRLIGCYVEKPGRILDVGCASGLFLGRAMDAGWEVSGVELSEKLCEKAKEYLGPQAEIHCSALQSAPLPASSFDAITLWDVLEHVRNPISFLTLCASLLKPGGYLFANVPNIDSIEARILRSHWPLLLAEHLNYFNPGSLRMCGDKASLKWEAFRRRSAAFSIDYVLSRLTQHRIPGTELTRRLVQRLGLGSRIVPVSLGELCGVWRSR